MASYMEFRKDGRTRVARVKDRLSRGVCIRVLSSEQ